jgi:hypothetical protein
MTRTTATQFAYRCKIDLSKSITPERRAAALAYINALMAEEAAMYIGQDAWDAANKELASARNAYIAAENANPTKTETRFANERAYRLSIGYKN